MGKGSDRHSRKKYTNDQQMHETMLNITGYQGCKTTINYHFTPMRMAIIIKRVTSIGKDGRNWNSPTW